MGMIAVQAGVGAHVIDTRPDEAKRSLEAIEASSKSALTEIRRVVGALRESGDAAETVPVPGIANLPSLTDELASTGLTVDLRIDPELGGMSPALELTVYRVVQEALTNVVKHARATTARVVIGRLDGDVVVEIVDDGVGTQEPSSSGNGIIGMRERVALHRGTLEARPLPERGFRVAARLPVETP